MDKTVRPFSIHKVSDDYINPKRRKILQCSAFTLQSCVASTCSEYKKKTKNLEDVIQKLKNPEKKFVAYDVTKMKIADPFLKRNVIKVYLKSADLDKKKVADEETKIQNKKFRVHLFRHHNYPLVDDPPAEPVPSLPSNRQVSETTTFRRSRTVKATGLNCVSRALTTLNAIKNDRQLAAPRNKNQSQLLYEYRENPTYYRRSPRFNNTNRPCRVPHLPTNPRIADYSSSYSNNDDMSSAFLQRNSEDGYESGFAEENDEPMPPTWNRIGHSKSLVPMNNNRLNNSLQINNKTNNPFLQASFETVQSLPTPNGSSIMMEEVTERRRMRILKNFNNTPTTTIYN
uniref:Uncharacterized protein n=1 Tax=Panagrolaimus sp. JU765 TaxID=591449 RepID=A0AC34QM37_9BILA